MAVLKLTRNYKKDTYTIGNLYLDGTWVCNTLEDKDRGLQQTMPLKKIQELKVYSKTAIPTGTYKVTLDVVSPGFSSKEFYKTTCKGKLPRLLNVPGFSGILIHVGNTAVDSAGCILVGYNRTKGKVIESKKAFAKLYELLEECKKRGENISIIIE